MTAMLMPMAKPLIGREIGDKLRAVAGAKGYTQGQVATNAGVSQPTVSALFNGGTADPPIGTVLKVARVLGVTLDELVGIKPLQIPEPAVESDPGDRLARVEADVARVPELARQVAELAKTMREHLQAQQAAGTQSRSAKAPLQRGKKPA